MHTEFNIKKPIMLFFDATILKVIQHPKIPDISDIKMSFKNGYPEGFAQRWLKTSHITFRITQIINRLGWMSVKRFWGENFSFELWYVLSPTPFPPSKRAYIPLNVSGSRTSECFQWIRCEHTQELVLRFCSRGLSNEKSRRRELEVDLWTREWTTGTLRTTHTFLYIN